MLNGDLLFVSGSLGRGWREVADTALAFIRRFA
jgi:hypothetical protein